MIWKITDIGRGKKTWREQASPSVTFPYLRDSKILIFFKTLSCISFILQQNIAIYASNELLMSNFGVYLQLKPLRYGVDEKNNQMTSQCRINARGYIRHWPNLVMVYRVTFMQSFNTRSSCSIKATMPQYYIEAYNIDKKNLGFLNADITSYLWYSHQNILLHER